MSYRNTFVTDYIYQASEEVRLMNEPVIKIFENWVGSGLINKVDTRGYGFYAGIFKGLYPTEYENDMKEIIPLLEKATKVPFRLAILAESGPTIIYDIKPYANN